MPAISWSESSVWSKWTASSGRSVPNARSGPSAQRRVRRGHRGQSVVNVRIGPLGRRASVLHVVSDRTVALDRIAAVTATQRPQTIAASDATADVGATGSVVAVALEMAEAPRQAPRRVWRASQPSIALSPP